MSKTAEKNVKMSKSKEAVSKLLESIVLAAQKAEEIIIPSKSKSRYEKANQEKLI